MSIESFRGPIDEREKMKTAAKEKKRSGVSRVWEKSDALNAEIIRDPYKKDPWRYFNMWFDGELPSKEERRRIRSQQNQ